MAPHFWLLSSTKLPQVSFWGGGREWFFLTSRLPVLERRPVAHAHGREGERFVPMGQRAVGRLHREAHGSRVVRRALFFGRHGAAGPTEVALGAEGGFISLAAAPGRLEGREHRVLGELLVHSNCGGAALLAWGGLPLCV